MIFMVQGSQPEPYTVEINLSPLIATCTCAAATNGYPCKHRIGILSGEDPGIISGDKNQLKIIEAIVRKSDFFDNLLNYDSIKKKRGDIEKQAEKAFKKYLEEKVRYELHDVKTDRSMIKAQENIDSSINCLISVETELRNSLAQIKKVLC